MSEEKEKLRECPFCDEVNKIAIRVEGRGEDSECYVECDNCEARGPSMGAIDEAVAAWELRPGEKEAFEAARTDLDGNPMHVWESGVIDDAVMHRTFKDWQKERQR